MAKFFLKTVILGLQSWIGTVIIVLFFSQFRFEFFSFCEAQLIRFVWSRKYEYDYVLLLETHTRNPFSFPKPKPIWEEIAKVLREGELKMKVTDRSCRERVNELLKKHRKEEGVIFRSTGAAEDKVTEMKELLTSINEMALTKPNEAHSKIYLKNNRKAGEAIRDAVLKETSDTDSDDYVTNKSNKKSRDGNSDGDEEMEFCTDVRGFFDNEEERRMDEKIRLEVEAIAEEEERRLAVELLTADQPSTQSNSWKDIPSSSSDNRFSVPEANVQCMHEDAVHGSDSDSEDTTFQQSNNDDAVRGSGSVAAVGINRNERNKTPVSTHSTIKDKNTAQTNKKSSSSKESAPATNSRFSNPKKDLIHYLERKSQNDTELRKEEIRIREMELMTKRDELQLLRLKSEVESEDRKRQFELDAENKSCEFFDLKLRLKWKNERKHKIF